MTSSVLRLERRLLVFKKSYESFMWPTTATVVIQPIVLRSNLLFNPLFHTESNVSSINVWFPFMWELLYLQATQLSADFSYFKIWMHMHFEHRLKNNLLWLYATGEAVGAPPPPPSKKKRLLLP